VKRARFRRWTVWIDAFGYRRVARRSMASSLKRKILRYIKLYQKAAEPFQWKYSDVRKRIPAW